MLGTMRSRRPASQEGREGVAFIAAATTVSQAIDRLSRATRPGLLQIGGPTGTAFHEYDGCRAARHEQGSSARDRASTGWDESLAIRRLEVLPGVALDMAPVPASRPAPPGCASCIPVSAFDSRPICLPRLGVDDRAPACSLDRPEDWPACHRVARRVTEVPGVSGRRRAERMIMSIARAGLSRLAAERLFRQLRNPAGLRPGRARPGRRPPGPQFLP